MKKPVKKKSALEKVRSALKKAESAHTPRSIMNKLKQTKRRTS
jgi:hypothetical protein